MKKNTLIMLFLAVIMVVSSKAFIALFAYQSAEKVKKSLNTEFAITYAWLSSNFDGSITFYDLSVTPYRLKRTFNIERLTLKYDNYLDLVTNLLNLSNGRHQGIQSLEVDSFYSALEGRDPEQWLKLEYGDIWAVPLGLYGCDNKARVDHDALRAMGIKELRGSLSLEKNGSSPVDQLSTSMTLALDKLGETRIDVVWNALSIPDNLSEWKPDTFQIIELALTHVEKGYFRRLNNYCSSLLPMTRDDFSKLASERWRDALSATGFEPGANVTALYRDYLLQGGQISLNLKPILPFRLGSYHALLDKNLIAYFGIKADLNGHPRELLDFYVSGQRFSAVPEEFPMSAMPDSISLSAERSDDATESYKAIEFIELEKNLGRNARITMDGGKVYEGAVIAITEKSIDLSQMLGGGSVTYTLKLDQIRSLEVWR